MAERQRIAGRYDVEGTLGTGGEARVLAAVDRVFGKPVALKQVRGAVRERLLAEFSLLSSLVHPSFVEALDFVEEAGSSYLVEARVVGEPLVGWARWRTPRDIAAAMTGVAHALLHLHARGFVHLDVKPENILVVPDAEPRAVLLDLGLARPVGLRGATGTPGFVAPEVLADEPVGGAADIYGFAATLCMALTGKAGGVAEITPVELAEALGRCLRDEPGARPDLRSLLHVLSAIGGVAAEELTRPLSLLPFVGRATELREVKRFLDGAPGVLAVTGQRGTGKTALLREVARRARLEGRDVLAVRDGASLVARLGIEAASSPAEEAGATVLALDERARKKPLVVCLDDADGAGLVLETALATLRRRPSGTPLWVLTASRGIPADGATLALSGFGFDDVVTCLELAQAEPRPHAEAEHLLRLTGGQPLLVTQALRAAAQRGVLALQASDIETPVVPPGLLPLAVAPQPVDVDLATRLVEPSLLRQASELGFVLLDAQRGTVRVVESARAALLAQADARAQRVVAQHLVEAGKPLEAVPLLVAAGDAAGALVLLGGGEVSGTDASWLQALVALAGAVTLPAWAVTRLRALAVSAGDLTAAEQAQRQSDDEASRVALAQVLVLRGRYADAVAVLRADDAGAFVRARAALFAGRAQEAAVLASAGLAGGRDDHRLDLLDTLGHARSQQGDLDGAESALREALELATALGEPRRIGRAQHALAIVLQRARSLDEAVELYRRSLVAAEPLAALARKTNLATALQDQGDYAAALALYHEAWSGALALGNAREQARLGVNLANLELWLGDVGGAARRAAETVTLASEQGLTHAAAMASLVRAEAELERRDEAAAAAALALARDALIEIEDPSALAELALLEARLARQTGAWEDAKALLYDLGGADVSLRLAREAKLEAARLFLAIGDRDGAANAAHDATGLAGDEPEASWRAAALYGHLRQDSKWLETARVDLQRFTARLPPSAQATYLTPPSRRELARFIRQDDTVRAPDAAQKRLLAINRRLAREHDVATLLELVVDTATELLGGERGFILLREADDVRVAVARNFDRRTLEGGPAVSRSIAGATLASGEPTLTMNALEDTRFAGNESVVALQVRSVLCVPLRGIARGDDPVIGALYLDHRAKERAFTDADVELASSFADQAAIALENARLLEQVRSQEQALQAQNGRLERLNAHLREEAATAAAEAEEALRRLREEGPTLGVGRGFERIVGSSDKLREALRLVDRFADTDVSVFVHGESGTGKELVARALHERSRRRERAFVSVNCGAIPEGLIESELFGYRRGAFTGAVSDKKGLFAAAEGGTLFLDEIGEMPLTMQVKLLRVLQERSFRPVGATADVAADVRVVSASHRDLTKLVAESRFREDLFYRLNVVEVRVPPLRERRADIAALVEHFSRQVARASADKLFTKPALQRLMSYDWPGNVRELENEVRRALALADGMVDVADLSDRLRAEARAGAAVLAEESRGSLKDIVDAFERDVLLATLKRTSWNVRRAAQELGLSRAAFYTRLNRFGITRDGDDGAKSPR